MIFSSTQVFPLETGFQVAAIMEFAFVVVRISLYISTLEPNIVFETGPCFHEAEAGKVKKTMPE